MSPPARQGMAHISKELGIPITTLQRWRRQFAGGGDGTDRRKGSYSNVSHQLGYEEHQRILQTCSEPEFVALPQGQIVPVLTDQGLIMVSERSFYRVLHVHGPAHRRERARLPQEPRLVPRLRANGTNLSAPVPSRDRCTNRCDLWEID